MHYVSEIECFKDYVDFNQDSKCVWVVYPPGAAGDLISSIINFHYIRTGAKFFGINNSGQVIFRDSNKKNFNTNTILNQNFINITNQKLSEENLNLSLMDQTIFSNHGWNKETIKQIINFFPNSKIIRILPQNNIEYSIIKWLSNYKNHNTITKFSIIRNFMPVDSFVHPQVCELNFGDLFNEEKFENLYNKIINHLNFDYKLIRFDFIKFWHSKQHPTIQSAFKLLSS